MIIGCAQHVVRQDLQHSNTKLLVSSKLTRGFPSEASIRSSQRRFRKPTKYPIVRGALLSADGHNKRGRYETTRAMRVLYGGRNAGRT